MSYKPIICPKEKKDLLASIFEITDWRIYDDEGRLCKLGKSGQFMLNEKCTCPIYSEITSWKRASDSKKKYTVKDYGCTYVVEVFFLITGNYAIVKAIDCIN